MNRLMKDIDVEDSLLHYSRLLYMFSHCFYSVSYYCGEKLRLHIICAMVGYFCVVICARMTLFCMHFYSLSWWLGAFTENTPWLCE
jgi:hypothetical protein